MSDDKSKITTRQLLDEIVKTRTELRNFIEASEARMLLEVESLNRRILNRNRKILNSGT